MYETIVITILFIVCVGLAVWNAYLHRALRRLTYGKTNEPLDQALARIITDLKEEQKFKKDMYDYLISVEKRLKRSLQGIHTVRFNPFKGAGLSGNQSFATALLDEHGNGVIISSLHARDHIGVFGKPITKYDSEFELTNEERQVLKEVRDRLSA